ncbi:MAG: helix-turn-helix domain-containing protein [Actinoplanes sp.]
MAGGHLPVTDEDRRQVAELHARGKSRNFIAATLGRSGRTVSRIAADLGLTFERSRTAAATVAKQADAKSRRAALALALLDDAERLRGQLFAACTVFNFGGKDNTFEQALINEPTFADKRNIMQAIGVAVDRAVKLDEYDAGTGLGEVVGLLDRLGKGLAAKYGAGDDEHPVDPDDEDVPGA